MAIKQRLLRAEKRLPPPPAVLQLPGVDVLVAETKRLNEWLQELGLTAAEAHKRRLKVPGNTFVTLPCWLEMDRRQPEFEAKRKAEQAQRDAEHEARMAKYRQGTAPCTSTTDRPAN